MNYNFKFQKILNLREREKEEAFNLYQDSVRNFEESAEKLFDLLKKKENLEHYMSEQLSQGFSILEIRHYQHFISNLEKTIEHHQIVVMNARNKMNWREEELKESNIEMKKYEKLKERNYKSYMKEISQLENMQLDEISAIQYFHREGN
ncbi:flagellar export protein FliJ [Lederbergia lenta]|uniref:Flagellar FliJ protein n=1 Tax=Lederbergia lenta TaxID=1467 RepID=A0A2X4WNJ0_LEDLE|nr:flagellar export protein FliJ [Lederbergia lenta]MEC2324279.1 flagellar export protein FliJ [Lederbergia lenta]SQI60232.1 flagellar export protein FliJ [Lederbergia lenta]